MKKLLVLQEESMVLFIEAILKKKRESKSMNQVWRIETIGHNSNKVISKET